MFTVDVLLCWGTDSGDRFMRSLHDSVRAQSGTPGHKAHQKLDAAVDAAYALCGGKKTWKNDAERVAFLFELYQRYTSLLPAQNAKTKRKIKHI